MGEMDDGDEDATDAGLFRCASAESVDRSLECPVCCSFLVEPLTLGCGHHFCRSCLLQATRLAPDGRCCPICRQTVDIRDPAGHPFDAAVDAAVRSVVAAADYDARLASDRKTIAHVLELTAQLLPIFAGFPGTTVGRSVRLAFREPRYKLLMRRAWEGNRLFAYVGHEPSPGVDAVIVRIESATFARDGKAVVTGVGVASITLRDVWVEEDAHGLFVTRLPPGGPQTWRPAPPLARRAAPPNPRCAALSQHCACALM